MNFSRPPGIVLHDFLQGRKDGISDNEWHTIAMAAMVRYADEQKNYQFDTLYAAALTGVCSNHILAQMFIEQQKSGIVGAQVNVPDTLAKQAHAIATAAMKLFENESKTGF